MDISEKLNDLFDESGTPTRKRVPTLSRITGVTNPGARKWLLGEVKTIEYNNLKSIADYFGVSIDNLVKDSNDDDNDLLDSKLKQLWESFDQDQRGVVLEMMESLTKLSNVPLRK